MPGQRVDQSRKCNWIMARSFALVIAAAVALLLGGTSVASESTCPSPLTDQQRFGFVSTSWDWPEEFDVGQLNAGWYVDFTRTEPVPSGMQRALVIRLSPGYTIRPDRLGPLVDRNPGAIWLIGNEPDCIWQDNVLPEEYASTYHSLYTFLKGRDATSQVAAGGIVQPTPLRLEYLNRVLAAYQARYGRSMPVDVWHIHNAILNEERGSWGAEIPPGLDAAAGEIRTIDDNDNLQIFEAQLWAFRQWMADHGYTGYPLIVTEFGVLMPSAYGFDTQRVNAYMSATFDFLQSATDRALGDPSDEYRLVQRWAWFSLDVPAWNPITGVGFNGNLFDPETTEITSHGTNYASYTDPLPADSQPDLGLAHWRTSRASSPIGSAQVVTRTVQARIANVGTAGADGFGVDLVYTGPVNGMHSQALSGLSPRASQWITFTLANLEPGAYEIQVEIDPENWIHESRECNNVTTGTLVVPTSAAFLPIVNLYYSNVPASLAHEEEPADVGISVASQATPAMAGFHEYELPTPNGFPGQIALDAQGMVWVTERGGNKIARFDPVFADWVEYDIPTPASQPWGLTVDAAGNVWFAESAGNRIGRLDGSGTITEYDVPTPQSRPWGITTGSGGTIWFTEKDGNQIGLLEPGTGEIIEYPIPMADAQPTGIASPGRYVWFTASGANSLGWRDLVTGNMGQFQLPTHNSTPQDVVVNSVGFPWLTLRDANKIALFWTSTMSDLNEVSAATPKSKPYGIAVQGNVAVWFTEKDANRLGRFTGPIPPAEFALPTPDSAPTDLVVDGEGCVWYTAPGANRIGRLCVHNLYTHQQYLPLLRK